ncbi:MAG: hypothetical protein ACI9DK_000665 [Vicingaceae bacterium]
MLSLPLSLFPQDSENEIQKFDLGINVGRSFSDVLAKSKDTLLREDFSPRVTGHLGLNLMYNPKPFLSVRSGFNSYSRGYKIKDELFFNSPSPSEIETVFSFVYVDNPIVAQFKLAIDVENGDVFLRSGGY